MRRRRCGALRQAAVVGGYGGITGGAHGLRLRGLRTHPAFGVRDPKTGTLQTIGQVHQDKSFASNIAVPGAYDVGSQRISWLSSAVTSWMRDDGLLARLRLELRRLNVFGDVQRLRGRVSHKSVIDGEHLVDLDIWCENQRSEVTAPGTATVIFPSQQV